MIKLNIKEALIKLTQGAEEIVFQKEFEKKLKKCIPLKIKVGFDPTAPDLHLGHTILINKMWQFQQMGHEVIFLIGDFTGLIGDPSGRNTTRPSLSKDEIIKNTETYKNQIFKILDPNLTQIYFNSTWIHKLGAEGLIHLAARNTVARMLERSDFKKRFSKNDPISIHEFIYPLIQSYDSVVLKSDVELGGRDQRFNLFMGREMQNSYGQEKQVIIMMPLLEGLDGINKMSKSLKNYISINDSPDEMFGKIMSISDKLMWRYFDLLSFRSSNSIQVLKNEVENGLNPMDIKFKLAEEIITRFHGQQSSTEAKKTFINRFSKGSLPKEIPYIELEVGLEGISITHCLKKSGLVDSTSNGLRMLKQGAVSIDSIKIDNNSIIIPPGSTHVIRVGKHRFARIFFKRVSKKE